MPSQTVKFTEALRQASHQLLERYQEVFIVGLGVSYKNGADGTTGGLKDIFPGRVLDVPVSEHAFTGMAVGAAISGLRPIVHHGRVEFALLAADQIFTQAAKWNYMFGGNNPVPIVLRIAVGRQWGNGPQHTQALYGLFGSVPGLKAVIPSTPRMAKGLLVSAVKDPNPVIILEPRWLYQIRQEIPEELYEEPLDKASVVKEGGSLTVVAYGDGFVSALEACTLVEDEVDVELIDVVSISPIDHTTIQRSIKKTGRLLCVDTTHPRFSIGADIVAHAAAAGVLRTPPVMLSCPDVPCPTSTALTEAFYPTKIDIANAMLCMFGKTKIERRLSFEELHLAPTLMVP